MGKVKALFSRIFRYGLLFLFSGYHSSLTLFYHAHLCNGQVVFHSHPFESNKNASLPFASHAHSPADLAYIQELNESIWEESPETLGIPENTSFTAILSDVRSVPSYVNQGLINTHLRAPPPV
jgi:hypothetical protein